MINFCPAQKKVAEDLGLKPVCHNPYMNTIAQVVEIVHCHQHAIDILEDLIKTGVDCGEEVVVGVNEKNTIPVKAGKGSGAVEVPRGILFHEYETDDKGIIQHANCVIPTKSKT